MKEIKAFVPRDRVADIVHGLPTAGFCGGVCNLSVVDVTDTAGPRHPETRPTAPMKRRADNGNVWLHLGK
jgi:hypothetical protein